MDEDSLWELEQLLEADVVEEEDGAGVKRTHADLQSQQEVARLAAAGGLGGRAGGWGLGVRAGLRGG